MAEMRQSNKHVQINDMGTAGWEVMITFRQGAEVPAVRSLIVPTYRQAKVLAQQEAVA